MGVISFEKVKGESHLHFNTETVEEMTSQEKEQYDIPMSDVFSTNKAVLIL